MVFDADMDVKWVVEHHAERVSQLFDALDLDRERLTEVREKWAEGDRVGACEALIAYYKAQERGFRRLEVTPGEGTEPAAERILQDRFTFQRVEGLAPRKENGALDWAYRGPEDDREWAYFLNRHGHLGVLLRAYEKTGNSAYVQCIDRHLREWVLVNPYPGEKTGEPQWRGLETHSRVGQWASIFYGLTRDDELSPAARILMLSAIPDHAHYLKHFHAAGGNWIAMELTSLTRAAVYWPEFQDAKDWISYAVDRLSPEMAKQVYPDGAQKELASGYHWTTLRQFEAFVELLQKAGRPPPESFEEGMERMYNYSASILRPDGYAPLNNDADRSDHRPWVRKGAVRYERPDWLWMVTNGEQGERPDGVPSKVFPWAGHVVMRSGWDRDAHWGFFDVGPWGIGHQHNDKLHVSVAAYGRDLLVDGGRMYYKGDRWRQFFRGTSAHNTVLIDGQGQSPDERETAEPLSEDAYVLTEELDYARGSFSAGYEGVEGEAVHTREVVYVRGKFWVVLDHVQTDRPRSVQVLWHYHPDCSIVLEGLTVTSTDAGKGNLRVVPASQINWEVEIVKGQEEPEIQGWWSREYNHREPSPAAIYSASVDGTVTFAWVLLPASGPVPEVTAELIGDEGVRLVVAGEASVEVTVGADGPRIKALDD
ncbi:MAG: alginate lyase family protein [bacterium]|nr:alginate lyase family protein [bacterium]